MWSVSWLSTSAMAYRPESVRAKFGECRKELFCICHQSPAFGPSTEPGPSQATCRGQSIGGQRWRDHRLSERNDLFATRTLKSGRSPCMVLPPADRLTDWRTVEARRRGGIISQPPPRTMQALRIGCKSLTASGSTWLFRTSAPTAPLDARRRRAPDRSTALGRSPPRRRYRRDRPRERARGGGGARAHDDAWAHARPRRRRSHVL